MTSLVRSPWCKNTTIPAMRGHNLATTVSYPSQVTNSRSTLTTVGQRRVNAWNATRMWPWGNGALIHLVANASLWRNSSKGRHLESFRSSKRKSRRSRMQWWRRRQEEIGLRMKGNNYVRWSGRAKKISSNLSRQWSSTINLLFHLKEINHLP